jgi:hypothetical protein
VEAMTDLIGTRLGDFEVVRELGRGSMSRASSNRQGHEQLRVPVLNTALSSCHGLPRVGHIDDTSTGVTKEDLHELMYPCTHVIFEP